MDHGQKIQTLAIGMDIVGKHIFNAGQARHSTFANLIGQTAHRLTGGDKVNRVARQSGGLGDGALPQRQIQRQAFSPRDARAFIAVDHHAGPRFQAGPCFIKIDAGFGVGLYRQRGKLCDLFGGCRPFDIGGKGLGFGHNQHICAANRQRRAPVNAFGLGGVIPVIGQ